MVAARLLYVDGLAAMRTKYSLPAQRSRAKCHDGTHAPVLARSPLDVRAAIGLDWEVAFST